MTPAERGVGTGTRSCGRRPGEVKRDSRSRRPGLGRHLEGWELAVVALGIAALAAALVVPRGAEPDILPLPSVDRRELERVASTERERAAEAESHGLPFEVRAVGESLRQYGHAEADQDPRQAELHLRELRRRVLVARAVAGDQPLLRLRAAQTSMFLAALEDWEAGRGQLGELQELGGAFIDKATASGWLSTPRRLDLGLAERMTLFRLRWSELSGLREGVFAPSANEWRLYYRFLLEHPEPGADSAAALRYVAAVQKYDPDYPALLARGMLELRAGRPAQAIEPLTAHLAARPSGRWRLRAQNQLARALALADAAER
jgi:hypothetical protein